MRQAVKCELRLYADDTCLIFQHSEINEIEIHLNKNFSSICNWFEDNKLSIHFGGLTKCLKARLEAAQNKCIRFCLKLGDRKSITVKEFEKINWLPIHERVSQCILSCIYKFHAKTIRMKFFTMQSAMEFLHVTLIKN